jgi:sulfur-carrier protein
MTTVRIPPVLHAETGGHRDVEVAGDTVRDVLAGLLAAFPGLEGKLLNHGELQPFVNLYVDGTAIEALDGLDTTVDPGATLLLLPAMAGGSVGRGQSAPEDISVREQNHADGTCQHCVQSKSPAVEVRPAVLGLRLTTVAPVAPAVVGESSVEPAKKDKRSREHHPEPPLSQRIPAPSASRMRRASFCETGSAACCWRGPSGSTDDAR